MGICSRSRFQTRRTQDNNCPDPKRRDRSNVLRPAVEQTDNTNHLQRDRNMPNKHHPKRGSLQFWPRARSKKHTARVRSWASTNDTKPLGFLGYKAGMTHVLVKETNSNSPRKGMEVFTPVTVIECPPMKVYSARYYANNEEGVLQVIAESFSKKVNKELARRQKACNKENKAPEQFDRVTLLVYTQPKLTGLGKKKPDMIEIEVGGKTLQEKSEYAQSQLDKEIKVSDVFRDHMFVDTHSVTKGKGFSGVVKKFGVKTLQHKSEKTKRGIGTMGAWTPKSVSYHICQPGKFGYHLRTEYNKATVKVGDKPEKINPKGGFLQYGFVKNDYVLIKGSIAGARKRPVTLTYATRIKKKIHNNEITYVSLESKQ
jgi:large subunit ribosomal protein L3